MFHTDHASAVLLVNAALYPEDLFVQDKDTPKIVFRKLRGALHEVNTPKGRELEGKRAFEKLMLAWDVALPLIKAGTFGQKKVTISLASATATAPSVSFFVKSKKGTYSELVMLQQGNVAHTYRGTDARGQKVIVKIARTPLCNEFLESEAQHISEMCILFPGKESGRYFPTMADSFTVNDGSDMLVVNVFACCERYIPLSHILKRFSDAGQTIDLRSAAWMYNRILEALAHAHPLSIVHGGVHPENILVHTESHRIVLTGFTSSVKQSEKVPYACDLYRHMYPEEVLGDKGKRKAYLSTDLYMAAATITEVLGGKVGSVPLSTLVPRVVRAFLDARLTEKAVLRDASAIAQRDRFGEILEVLYGPPKFHHFVFPKL